MDFFSWLVDFITLIFGLITRGLDLLTGLFSFLSYVLIVPLDIFGALPYIISLSASVVLIVSVIKFILGR